MLDFDRTESELQRRFAKVSWRKKELVARTVCITMGDNRCRCDFLHSYRGYARDVINRMRRHCGDINRINTGFNRPVVRGY